MPSIDREGLPIFFDDHGSGLPVVLGHSFLCSGEMWAPQVPRLAEQFRVINIDYRGHGRSGHVDRPYGLYDLVGDVLAVLDHLGVQRAVWAGLSIGGMVALRAALSVPDRVSGLVLLDSHAGAERTAAKLKYRALGIGARLFGIARFVPAIMPLMFGRTTLRDQPVLVREWEGRLAKIHLPSILCGLGALTKRDSVVERLSEIRVPTLVIVGEEDISLPPRCSQRIAAGILSSSLEVIPRAGHLVSLEQPEAVTELMAAFLERLSKTPAD